mgnify:FL=1
MCSVAEFETLSTAESMWFPGVSLSDVSVSFRCFDWMAILSGCSGYILSSARGTENFIIISHRCGNRRKFTSMFNLRLAGTSCASVAGCQTKFRVPLTALIMHPHFGEPCSTFVKHWKDGFYHRKKNMHFRTAVFYSRKRYF